MWKVWMHYSIKISINVNNLNSFNLKESWKDSERFSFILLNRYCNLILCYIDKQKTNII